MLLLLVPYRPCSCSSCAGEHMGGLKNRWWWPGGLENVWWLFRWLEKRYWLFEPRKRAVVVVVVVTWVL
jgi:hypothetical protein